MVLHPSLRRGLRPFPHKWHSRKPNQHPNDYRDGKNKQRKVACFEALLVQTWLWSAAAVNTLSPPLSLSLSYSASPLQRSFWRNQWIPAVCVCKHARRGTARCCPGSLWAAGAAAGAVSPGRAGGKQGEGSLNNQQTAQLGTLAVYEDVIGAVVRWRPAPVSSSSRVRSQTWLPSWSRCVCGDCKYQRGPKRRSEALWAVRASVQPCPVTHKVHIYREKKGKGPVFCQYLTPIKMSYLQYGNTEVQVMEYICSAAALFDVAA